MNRSLYFDHNATTPPRPEALEAAGEAARHTFGNPSSQHAFGREARALLEDARERLAKVLEVRAAELFFTSGGTESNRLALEGALQGAPAGGPGAPHAVSSALEHASILELLAALEGRGALSVTRVGAREDGRAPAQALVAAVRPDTRVVCLQHANNETGAIQEVGELARALQERSGGRGAPPRPLLIVDAVQSLGKIPVRPADLGADIVSIASHKAGGPKGVGALWVRGGCGFDLPLRGGPQERKVRPGTEALPAIVGFVRAAELAVEELNARDPGAEPLGSYLARLVLERIPGAQLNGGPEGLLPGTANLAFSGVEAELLVIRLDQEGVAVSMGSACASGSREPSHVLRAMGLGEARVRSSIRFSTGWTTRREDVDRLVSILEGVVRGLRERSSRAP